MDTNHHVIALRELLGNEATSLTVSQKTLEPFVGEITFFWWCMWVVVLVFLMVTYIIKPLLKKQK